MSRFDEVWPTLERRVRAVLIARGVRGEELNDLAQETALRLFRAWPTLDPERPVLPYATTVALNAWRDGLKRASTTRELLDGAPPEQADPGDVERTVLARLEVSRVSAALRQLRPRDRDALMAEDSGPAHRMARMRARRELIAAMERASAVVGVLFGLRHVLRPRGSALAASAGALTLVSMVAIGSAPSSPARIQGSQHIALRPVASAPLAVHHPKQVARHLAAAAARVHHVVHKHRPAAAACADQPTTPPPNDNSGLPVSAQILGPEAVLDISLKPTGTRVRSQNDGCTQVVAGP